MRIDRLTVKAREAIVAAQEVAARRGHAEVQPEHVLDALITQDGGFVPAILKKVGVDPMIVARHLGRAFEQMPSAQGASLQVGLSPRSVRLLERAEEVQKNFKDEYL